MNSFVKFTGEGIGRRKAESYNLNDMHLTWKFSDNILL